MTILTIDSGTSSQFNNLIDLTEVRDESGRVLGYFHPVNQVATSEKAFRQSPFSDEELRVRRQQRTGKSLSEVLAKLQAS